LQRKTRAQHKIYFVQNVNSNQVNQDDAFLLFFVGDKQNQKTRNNDDNNDTDATDDEK